jgi:NitT/TauT family transport system substrate-binding protein
VRFVYANAADILRNVAAGNVEFGFPNANSVVAARANDSVKVIRDLSARHRRRCSSARRASAPMPICAARRVAVTSLGSPNCLAQVGLRAG